MADFIPEPLRQRLGEEQTALLVDVARLVERTLRHVYDADGRNYDPSWGDNAQLFGMGIWHHGWHAIEEALDELVGVAITHEDNSHRLRLGDLTIAVYKGGDDETDSIFDMNLNGSATKRAYVDRNQLTLFSADDLRAPVEDRAYDLKTLWLSHFGNPREGLVKPYIGAPARDSEDNSDWAWHARVDAADGGGDGTRRPVPELPPPFDQQPEPEILLELEDDLARILGVDGE